MTQHSDVVVDAILDFGSNLDVEQLSNVDVVVQFLLVEIAVYLTINFLMFVYFWHWILSMCSPCGGLMFPRLAFPLLKTSAVVYLVVDVVAVDLLVQQLDADVFVLLLFFDDTVVVDLVVDNVGNPFFPIDVPFSLVDVFFECAVDVDFVVSSFGPKSRLRCFR